MSSFNEMRDLRRCVTSPIGNGVDGDGSNGKPPATLDAARMLRQDDVTASGRIRRLRAGGVWLRQPASESDAQNSHQHVAMFVKNQRVKFHLGHDDELHDVITRDVIASI